jgi:hypothetical protein
MNPVLYQSKSLIRYGADLNLSRLSRRYDDWPWILSPGGASPFSFQALQLFNQVKTLMSYLNSVP